MHTKIMARVFILAVGMLLTRALLPVQAEDSPAEHMQLVKDKIKADKKLFIAENMQLTEKEAKAFWPVYDRFQKDLDEHNKKFSSMIDDYAKTYDTMTDEQAYTLINTYLGLETGWAYLIKAYIPKLKKALGMKKAMRYLQLENKIHTLHRFDLAVNIPLAK
jgi:hypothetical protein